MIKAYYPELKKSLSFLEGELSSLCHPERIVERVSFNKDVIAKPFIGGDRFGEPVELKKGEEMNIRHCSGSFGTLWVITPKEEKKEKKKKELVMRRI